MFLFLRFLLNNKLFCRCLHYFGSNKKLEAHTGLQSDELRDQVAERRR